MSCFSIVGTWILRLTRRMTMGVSSNYDYVINCAGARIARPRATGTVAPAKSSQAFQIHYRLGGSHDL